MYKIIVVDDETRARNIVAKYIENTDAELDIVGTFDNGEDAIEFLKTNKVDIVLTDIKMPKKSGLDVACFLYENMPACKVVLISGYSEFDYAKKAIEFGVFNYLLKPIDLSELKATLDKIKLIVLDTIADDEDINYNTQQEFLIDLLVGSIEENEFQKCFDSATFPLGTQNSSCLLIILEIGNLGYILENIWDYGKDKLIIAMRNILQEEYVGAHVYDVMQKGEKFSFVITSDESEERLYKKLEVIIENLNSVLKIAVSNKQTYYANGMINLARNEMFLQSGNFVKQAMSMLTNKNSDSIIDDKIIQKAKEYINNYYCDNISRDDVAEYVHLNSAYFSRYFKRLTGESFYDFLTTTRIKKAIELLNGDVKIYEIVDRIGYKSKKHFLKIFKAYTGYTPTDYRRYVLMREDYTNEW